MKPVLLIAIFLVLLWCIPTLGFEQAPKSETHNPNATVLGDPNAPSSDDRFEPNDLAFRLADIKQMKWQNAYYSVEFYAVLLKSKKAKPDQGVDSAVPCGGHFKEKERKEVQALFAMRKVFASRFGCTAHPVSYTSTNADYNFLAVYGGTTKDEAQKALAEAKAIAQFKSANLRKMRVVYDFGD